MEWRGADGVVRRRMAFDSRAAAETAVAAVLEFGSAEGLRPEINGEPYAPAADPLAELAALRDEVAALRKGVKGMKRHSLRDRERDRERAELNDIKATAQSVAVQDFMDMFLADFARKFTQVFGEVEDDERSD